MSNSQQIFEAWLAGKITASECEQQLDPQSEWLERFHTAQIVQRQAKAPFLPQCQRSTPCPSLPSNGSDQPKAATGGPN